MKEYNYSFQNINKNSKKKKNHELSNKQISLINNLKSLNNNYLVKKMLGFSKNENIPKFQNQVIIHTEINNYRPIKEYIINLKDIKKDCINKYKKNLSPQNLVIPLQNAKNKSRYIHLQNQINNNSFSRNNKNSSKKISTQIIKVIKPYKKKSVRFKPSKKKDHYPIINLDLTNNFETINGNCITERTFDMKKTNFYKDEEDLNLFNIKDNKSNKCFNNIFIRKTLKNEQINNLLDENKNNQTITNFKSSLNIKKNLCKRILLSKKHIPNKKYNHNNDINKNDIISQDINDKYQKRFTKILILLLEKYFKTSLLKYKYIFINNLKLYKKVKNIFINNKRNKKNIIPHNSNCLTDRTNKTDKFNNSFYKTNYIQKNENLLLQQLKNENIKISSDKLNFIELFRNKSELFKKEIIINRRKESKSKSKSKSKEKDKDKNISNDNLNNNIIKNNKARDTAFKTNKSNKFYNKTKPMLIIKKLKTSDNRINIDIKYLEQTNNNNKKKMFTKLKIAYTNSINLIRKTSDIFKFDKIYYNIENTNNYTFKKEKKFSTINEEEQNYNLE